MNEILCSTGALIGRPNNRDYTLLQSLSENLRCDGFEFMMYDTWYEKADRMVKDLKEMGLRFPVLHCEKSIGQALGTGEKQDLERALENFKVNCQIAGELGADRLVLHLWDGMISDSHFENNLRGYEPLREIADEWEMELLVENVVCNHADPLKHWYELYREYGDVLFVYDTKMAAFHDEMDLLYQKPFEWLWRGKHIRHYHINDYGGGFKEWNKLKSLPIGAGHVDFDRFFQFVRKTGYQGSFTVESTAFGADGAVDVAMLNDCFDRIRNYLNPNRRREMSAEEKEKDLEKQRMLRTNGMIPGEVLESVDRELDEYFKDVSRRMGFCHRYWREKKARLEKLGYEWFSPAEVNPDCRFD